MYDYTNIRAIALHIWSLLQSCYCGRTMAIKLFIFNVYVFSLAAE